MTALVFLEWTLWPLLLSAPLVALGLLLAEVARRRRLSRVLGPREGALLTRATSGRRRSALLFAGGVLLALVALLRPVHGETDDPSAAPSLDLVLCLDLSRSMLARDEAPDRLTRARREVRSLAAAARGERVALVAFAGEARLAVPLTEDLDALAAIADSLDPADLAVGGSDLGAAIEAAGRALEARGAPGGAVVLLTDGEDSGGRALAEASRLARRAVAVHAVGLGSPQGSKIPVIGPDGAPRFLADRAGRDVVTALDVRGLAAIVAPSGGALVQAGDGEEPLVSLLRDRLLPEARGAAGADRARRGEQRFQWPLLAAFLLWMLESWFAAGRGRRA
jgi:Ca-activated chloride channel family protein